MDNNLGKPILYPETEDQDLEPTNNLGESTGRYDHNIKLIDNMDATKDLNKVIPSDHTTNLSKNEIKPNHKLNPYETPKIENNPSSAFGNFTPDFNYDPIDNPIPESKLQDISKHNKEKAYFIPEETTQPINIASVITSFFFTVVSFTTPLLPIPTLASIIISLILIFFAIFSLTFNYKQYERKFRVLGFNPFRTLLSINLIIAFLYVFGLFINLL